VQYGHQRGLAKYTKHNREVSGAPAGMSSLICSHGFLPPSLPALITRTPPWAAVFGRPNTKARGRVVGRLAWALADGSQ